MRGGQGGIATPPGRWPPVILVPRRMITRTGGLLVYIFSLFVVFFLTEKVVLINLKCTDIFFKNGNVIKRNGIAFLFSCLLLKNLPFVFSLSKELFSSVR